MKKQNAKDPKRFRLTRREKMPEDKSTEPAKAWCEELGFRVIDKMNDGESYTDRKGKSRTKKNLGCDFWIEQDSCICSVEAKSKMGKNTTLNVRLHQLDRLKEGGIMILVGTNKDGTHSFDVKTHNDILETRQTTAVDIVWK